MKGLLLILLFSFIALESLPAQVLEENSPMSLGTQPALTVILKDTEIKFAEAEWKDYVKNYGKVVKVKGFKESVLADVHVGEIGGGDLIDVYSYAEAAAEGTKMIIWFNTGSKFLSSEDKEYPRGVKFVENFAHKVKVDLVAIDLENQQKKLAKFETDYEKLQRENANLHKLIEDSKAKIEQAELDIQANLKAQDLAKAEVDNQRKVVESVQDNPDELKAQQKVLSKNESNYAKLQKENTTLHKVIDDSNAKIKQAELDIQANLEAQAAAQSMIEEQQSVVEMVQKKLDGLKSNKPD